MQPVRGVIGLKETETRCLTSSVTTQVTSWRRKPASPLVFLKLSPTEPGSYGTETGSVMDQRPFNMTSTAQDGRPGIQDILASFF